MTTFPSYPSAVLNAGGANDPGRYTLGRIIALAESLARGVVPDAAPVAVADRAQNSDYLLNLFDAMLPASYGAKQQDNFITLTVPDATTDSGERKVKTAVQTVRDALATLSGETADKTVINGTSRTLACVLLWSCGQTVPDLPVIVVEGSNDELRDMSAKGNSIHSFARNMSYGSRIAYALSLYDSGVITEAAIMARAGVNRGVGQLMHSAAVAIRKHDLKPDEQGQYPKLDKEGWRKVKAAEAGSEVEPLLNDNVKSDTRYLSIKRLCGAAERCPAGPAGDVIRAIADDDGAALAKLLGVNL
jgi:hypothetical protein